MQKQAFLFDLDGVLVDTATFHFLAWQRLAQTLGFKIDEDFNETLKGVSRMESLDRILKFGGVTKSEAEKQVLASQKNIWYLELVNQMSPKDILPGVQDFLINSKALGLKTAVCSASKNAPTILEKIQMSHWFNAIIDGSQVTKSKPDPEVFLKGATALNLSPSKCVVFEDAFAGVEAGNSAGMFTVGIGTLENLSNADTVIKGFAGQLPIKFL